MLKGSKPGIVKKIQPVSIHGQVSLDVHVVDPDEPTGKSAWLAWVPNPSPTVWRLANEWNCITFWGW